MENSAAGMVSVCLGLSSVMKIRIVMTAVMKCSVSPLPAARLHFAVTTQCACHACGPVTEILIVQMVQTSGLRTAVTNFHHLPAGPALIGSSTVAQGNVFQSFGDVTEIPTAQINQMRKTVVSLKPFFSCQIIVGKSYMINFNVVDVHL